MVRAGNFRVWVVAMAAMVAGIAATTVALLWWNTEPARSASTLPQGFTDSLVAQVPNPTAMAIAPDGRLFVTQKANNIGRLRVIKKGQLLTKPFLRVTTDTSDFRGLLGVTLDPNFSRNHYVYIFYTATSPTVHNHVSRHTANGEVAVASSEKVILNLPALSNTGGHYGGSLRFGSDGKLYVGVGDDTTYEKRPVGRARRMSQACITMSESQNTQSARLRFRALLPEGDTDVLLCCSDLVL
jgi:glucose/arabinose dehydrogenase